MNTASDMNTFSDMDTVSDINTANDMPMEERTGKRPGAIEFLKKWGMDPQSVDMEEVCNGFLADMSKALYNAGESSSMPMIPTFCTDSAVPAPGKKVIVIDAGGTNLRTCIVSFDETLSPSITDFKKTKMPGSQYEVSAKTFFSMMADEVERLLPQSRRIGFCFSYAAEILPDLDGIPLLFSKEIRAPEVIGKKLGKCLLEELASRGHDMSAYRIGIVNDTVATLLAGKAAANGREYSGFVGYILGTGTNTAYVEQTSRIKKLALDNLPPSMIINMESGCYREECSRIDEEFRQTTKDPGKYHFEKMISGAYLGPLAFLVIRKAVEEGVFSSEFAAEFSKLESLTTIQLSNFLEQPQGREVVLARCASFHDRDREELYILLDSFISRAAKLTACNIAAALIKTGRGMDPSRPVCVNADGTTFYKTKNLKRYTDFYLYQFVTQRLGCHYDFVNIQDSPVLGAAIAALGLK